MPSTEFSFWVAKQLKAEASDADKGKLLAQALLEQRCPRARLESLSHTLSDLLKQVFEDSELRPLIDYTGRTKYPRTFSWLLVSRPRGSSRPKPQASNRALLTHKISILSGK
jgi:hypothetical protein